MIKGHLQNVCWSKQNRTTRKPKPVNTIQDVATDKYEPLNIASSGKTTPLNVTVDIEIYSLNEIRHRSLIISGTREFQP